MRVFSGLYFISIQVSVFLLTTAQCVIAQETPSPVSIPLLSPTPKTIIESTQTGISNDATTSSLLSRYILGPGDGISIQVQRPPGKYRLGPGDAISVVVQRFPELNFQAAINSEGNITVPLLGTVSLQNLTLEEAQLKVRSLLNSYLVEPVVTLSLIAQRQDLNFSASINPEGNIILPQVGTVSLSGLTLEEAQEKIRFLLSKIVVDPVVSVLLMAPRAVQVTISGEVTRPGIYTIGSITPRVNDALLLAGGSTMMADLRQVQIRRKLVDGSIAAQTLDLYTPLQNGGAAPSLRLQDGDAVIVPPREQINDDHYDRNLVARSSLAQAQIKIRVLNYASGGLVTQVLPNGSNFIDALSGINPDNANLREIALVRFDPERGKAVTQRLDGKKVLSGDVSQNVPLQDNDVIVIGRSLVGRITNLVSTITRPFFDVQSFLRFFETFGGGGR